MKIITPPPLAHNTLSDTPTTQRLTFRLIKIKIFIFIKPPPPLAYHTLTDTLSDEWITFRWNEFRSHT